MDPYGIAGTAGGSLTCYATKSPLHTHTPVTSEKKKCSCEGQGHSHAPLSIYGWHIKKLTLLGAEIAVQWVKPLLVMLQPLPPRVPDSWLRPGSALAVAATRRMNEQMKDLCLSLSK